MTIDRQILDLKPRNINKKAENLFHSKNTNIIAIILYQNNLDEFSDVKVKRIHMAKQHKEVSSVFCENYSC